MTLAFQFQHGEVDRIRTPKLNNMRLAVDAATAITSDATIIALAALDATAGILVQTAADTFTKRTLAAPAAGLTITNPAGVAGDPTFALANDLAALEALSGTNTLYYRSAADTWSAVTIGAMLAFAGGTLNVSPDTDGTLAANSDTRVPSQKAVKTYADTANALDLKKASNLSDLANVATAQGNLSLVPGTNVFKQRTITGTANEVSVANGDGVSANPTLSLPSSLTFTGKTITGGTYSSVSSLTATGNISGFDFHASRGDGTGVIFLNAANTRYLYYDGSQYFMPDAPLSVPGGFVTSGESRCSSLRIDATPSVSAVGTSHKLAVNLNGTTYYILLSNV